MNAKKILLAVLSGLLCFLAFPPFEYGFLAWIALIPLLFAIRGCTLQQAFVYSYIAGLVFFACLWYWFVNVSVPGMIVMVLFYALFFGVFGFFVSIILKYSIEVMIIPFVWVVLEYLRSVIFTGFPWGFFGYTQYTNLTLIQISDLTGCYGVSFLLVMFNTALFSHLKGNKNKILHMMSVLILLVLVITYGRGMENKVNLGQGPNLSVLQGNIPQRFKWDPGHAEEIIRTYHDLSVKATREKPDLIIWPETSYPFLVEREYYVPDMTALASGLNVPILTGAVYSEGEALFNSAFLVSDTGEVIERYDKTHLVPFGEYIPFEKQIFFLLRKFIDKPIGNYTEGKKYSLFPLRVIETGAGKGGIITRTTSYFHLGVMICFEDCFPYIGREFVKKGADILVNMTNDAWFGNTAAARQHLQASVFRAIENRVPVVRAANTGISCFIAPNGKVISSVTQDEKEIFVSGFKTAKIPLGKPGTFYTLKGDLFVLFCLIMTILVFLVDISLYKKRQ